MKERLSPIEINGYDSQGPEVNSQASISFEDPGNRDGLCCVCFMFNGAESDVLINPLLWEYHHTNYWTPETLENDSVHENLVSKKRVVQILKKQGQTIDSLLENYCILFGQSKKIKRVVKLTSCRLSSVGRAIVS